jgi:sulfur carrier protein
MHITVNGRRQSVNADNIAKLVNNLDLSPETVLVEHNGVALLRSEWTQTPVADGDSVEILKVAAGG